MDTKSSIFFKKRFAALRKEYGMTQKDFSEFLGISRPTVGFYENGDRIPDAQILAEIAVKCQVSSDWLLGLTEYRNKTVQGYNLEDMGFSEKAANMIDVLSTSSQIATRVNADDAVIMMGKSFGLLVKILEKPEFYQFLANASAYVEADPARWKGSATLNLSNGVGVGVPVEVIRDSFWAHCVAPLKECLGKIEFVEVKQDVEDQP